MRVYEMSLTVLRGLGQAARAIAGQDLDLARQLRRAGTSVPLNIAEGAHGRGRRKQLSFSVALGSARESRACIHAAAALGYVEGDAYDALLGELDAVIAMLYSLSR